VNQLTDEDVLYSAAGQADLYPNIKALIPPQFIFPRVHTRETILPVLQSAQFRAAIEYLEEVLLGRGLSPDLMHALDLRTKDGMNWDRFRRCLHRLRPRLDTGSFSGECVADIEDDCHCDTCEPPPDFSDDESDDEYETNDSEDGQSEG